MLESFARLNVFFVILLAVAGCSGGSSSGASAPPSPPPPAFDYAVPEDIGDGWQVGDIAAEDFELVRVAVRA